MANVVLHVGTPKTASSTLQTHLFPELKDVLYLGKFIKPGVTKYYLTDELQQKFREIETLDMDFRMESASIKEIINGLCDVNQVRRVLLSEEGISNSTGPNPMIKLQRYQSIFDDMKIIY